VCGADAGYFAIDHQSLWVGSGAGVSVQEIPFAVLFHQLKHPPGAGVEYRGTSLIRNTSPRTLKQDYHT